MRISISVGLLPNKHVAWDLGTFRGILEEMSEGVSVLSDAGVEGTLSLPPHPQKETAAI